MAPEAPAEHGRTAQTAASSDLFKAHVIGGEQFTSEMQTILTGIKRLSAKGAEVDLRKI